MLLLQRSLYMDAYAYVYAWMHMHILGHKHTHFSRYKPWHIAVRNLIWYNHLGKQFEVIHQIWNYTSISVEPILLIPNISHFNFWF